MADENTETKPTKRRTGRSPAYPFIPVQKAIEQARALYEQEGEYECPLPSALSAWGYGPKSSGGRQTLATMKYYGLIDISGEGEQRKIKVSDIAKRIILDPRDDHTERRALIRKVALEPAAHRSLFNEYPNGLASEGTVKHFLMFDLGFKADAANELLDEFKQTVSYSGLYESGGGEDKRTELPDEDEEQSPPELKVGDRVQVTVDGQDLFADGAKIIGFSEDGEWVFTDQSSAAAAISEVSLLESRASESPKRARPEVPTHLLKAKEERPEGTRRAVFPLDEGDVTLIFPEDITADGLGLLADYLDIFLKREQKKKANDG